MKFIEAIFYYVPLKKKSFYSFLGKKVGEAVLRKFLLAQAANVFALG